MSLDPRWAQYTSQQIVEPGQYIFKEGDPSDALYIILSGQVAIHKEIEGSDPLVLGYRGKDELIGEVSLLHETSRSASVLAIDRTTLLSIGHDAFWKLFDSAPAFRQMITDAIIERLLAADLSRVRAAVSEQQLFDRLGSIKDENERLAELMQLRNETIGFIVHDLRNPLNLVQMALSMIEVDPAYSADADTRRFLAMASGGVRRVFALIESLLDVERLDSGEVVLNLAPVDLAALVDTVVQRIQPLARASKVELTAAHREADMPPIIADQERLDRVITNLVDNGLKFTPASESVTVTTWHDGDHEFVSVEDGGPGIPQEQRARVFDRFVQGNQQSRGSRGFGLGLAFCRSAVQAHGGRIWLEDTAEGKGVRFVFALPITPSARAKAAD